jgi:hypothetical protein
MSVWLDTVERTTPGNNAVEAYAGVAIDLQSQLVSIIAM